MRLMLAVCLAAAIAAPASAKDPVGIGALRILDPWARATAGPARNGAVFLVIRNTGGEADRLSGVDTPAAAMALIHETTMLDGVMRMRPVDALEIPAGGAAVFKPHGLHVMLMKLKAPLRQGGHVLITLHFEEAGSIEIAVPIAAAGAMSSPHSN